MSESGVTPVYSIEGGTTAWERMGLPVEPQRQEVGHVPRTAGADRRRRARLSRIRGAAWFVHAWFLAIPAFVGAEPGLRRSYRLLREWECCWQRCRGTCRALGRRSRLNAPRPGNARKLIHAGKERQRRPGSAPDHLFINSDIHHGRAQSKISRRFFQERACLHVAKVTTCPRKRGTLPRRALSGSLSPCTQGEG